MASAASSPVIAERTDIHKSCKALEVVVNVLNDYCEAANAVVALQKRLAKALRDAAATKCTADIPASALNASATIFEALSEVDTKFAKIADKECDSISTEVKKWFKKLAKEERAHDERIATANARIRQAGQNFEKKSKRSPRDAAEEHTRYINLLSTLGPEVNQDKYNHALFVTHRHSMTMYSLAACLSRVADAEWLRSCEGVRRFAPNVGQLGEWRALCEGGWSGPLPPNLADVESHEGHTDTLRTPLSSDKDARAESDSGSRAVTPFLEKPAPDYSSRNPSEQGHVSSRAATPSSQSPNPPPHYFSASHEQPADAPTTTDTQSEPKERASKSSLASLDSFPSPPTHFPLPPVNGVKSLSGPTSPSTSKEFKDESPSTSQTSSSVTPFPRVVESPIPEDPNEMQTPPLTAGSLSPAQRDEVLTPISQVPSSSSDTRPTDQRGSGISSTYTGESAYTGLSALASTSTPSRADAEQHDDTGQSPTVRPKVTATYKKGDYVDDAEFGVRKSMDATAQSKHRASGSISKIERSDTGKTNGSIVAAIRDRYARTTGPASPPPKDVPRLPTSVTEIATKYEAPATQSPPRQRAISPGEERRRPSVDIHTRAHDSSSADRNPAVGISGAIYASSPTSGPPVDELSLRRQRIEELEELEIREQELQLRMKEREIEQRALELERDRLRLRGARGTRAAADGYTSDSARTATTHLASPTLPQARYHAYSLSTTHLVPPPLSSAQSSVHQRPHPSSQPPSPSPLHRPADHAPYCGCDACSASQYKSAARNASPRDLRPPEAPPMLRPEKPKGWIRRLSMPVMGGAFSLDSKKGVSSAGIAGGPGYRNSLALAEEDGRFQTDLTGGIRNRSATNLARR
ncbi:hypothetical protein OBBRIDRAFT_788874 [Obba rivulosa]|uniref:Uncharacterized protein n=1 Tax=Obba rivulosa TaxID=1052685 RepID=A0A8E2DSM2_9APHY|nr:hypothetical protein OBBRIDRAFT_788874 [Obba rivulosa]